MRISKSSIAALWRHIATTLSVLMIALFATLPEPAAAQGVFDFLFGGNKPAPRPRAPVPEQVRPRAWQPPGTDFAPFGSAGQPTARASRAGQGRSGGYRTVCVRLCDGYFFPISFGVRRGAFYSDAQACQSRCESAETRLFHMPTGSTRIEEARDDRGRSYEDLDNAYLYRKKYVADCSCRPKPWSVAELSRHGAYAVEAARRAEEQRRKTEDELIARTTGIDVALARKLFEEPMAEAMPPAPSDDWQAPRRKRPVVVAEAPTERSAPTHEQSAPRATTHLQQPPVSRYRRRPRSRPNDVAPRRRVASHMRRRSRRPSSGSGWFAGLGAGSGPKYRWPGDR